MRLFFTADTHVWHSKIILYSKRHQFLSDTEKQILADWHEPPDNESRDVFCGIDLKTGKPCPSPRKNVLFIPCHDSITRMNDAIIEEINRYVEKDDILWHLGDVGWFPKDHIYEAAKAFRDRIKCKTVNLVFGNHDRHGIASAFNYSCGGSYRLKHGNQSIILNHYAQAVWQHSHYGSIHLYGHSHTSAEDWLDKHMPGRRSVDVGVDNAFRLYGKYRPFSYDDDIEPMMRNRPGCSIDHHKMRMDDET